MDLWPHIVNYIYFNEHVSKFSTLTMANVCKVIILFVVLKGEGSFSLFHFDNGI